MSNYGLSRSHSVSTCSSDGQTTGNLEDDGTSPHTVAHHTEKRQRDEETRQRDLGSKSASQTAFSTQDLQLRNVQPGEPTLEIDFTTQTANSQAPRFSTILSGHAGASSSSPSLWSPRLSTTRAVAQPVGGIESELEELRRSQEIIPSNPNATRRLPKRLDFPPSIHLEVVQPVTEHQIEFAIVMLQDHGVAERSLEYLARRLQQQYPENAYVLIPCPETERDLHGWAGPRNDCKFVATSRMLLIDVVTHSLIVKCGFKARQIVILGHGQGGTAALTAVAWWESIQFAGVVSIGGALPASSQPPEGVKAQTPALLLGSRHRSNSVSVLQRVDEVFIHTSHWIAADLQELPLEAPDIIRTLLEPITDFFAHRLRREEWTKQAVISFGKQLGVTYSALILIS